MRTAGRVLVLGWLLAALVVLALDGRLPGFLAWAIPGSTALLVGDALVRWHRRPSAYCRPPLPDRYRVADDLRRPLADVVAAAEAEASTGPR
jgi:glyoxylase-like metal-dependent hydrolase (beta-lactamase superfamily II)